MAAGFGESYVRLWSLNGDKLRGYQSDFSSGSIRDSKHPISLGYSLYECHSRYIPSEDS